MLSLKLLRKLLVRIRGRSLAYFEEAMSVNRGGSRPELTATSAL